MITQVLCSGCDNRHDRQDCPHKGYLNPVACVMCDNPNVAYTYPAPMCVPCHADWAE